MNADMLVKELAKLFATDEGKVYYNESPGACISEVVSHDAWVTFTNYVLAAEREAWEKRGRNPYKGMSEANKEQAHTNIVRRQQREGI